MRAASPGMPRHASLGLAFTLLLLRSSAWLAGPRRLAPRVAIWRLHSASSTEDFQSWRAKDLKAELRRLGSAQVETILEKGELVAELQRLVDGGAEVAGPAVDPAIAATRTKGQGSWRRIGEHADFTLQLQARQVQGQEMRDAALDVSFRPTQMSFLVVKCGCRSNGVPRELNLILDTACSAMLLRPQSVQKLGLQVMAGAGTMTALGGTSNVATAKLDGLHMLCMGSATKTPEIPVVFAAVQDVGVLPDDIDGIYGMSGFSPYAGFDIDIERKEVHLYRRPLPPLFTTLSAHYENAGTPGAPYKAPLQQSAIQVPYVDARINGCGHMRLLFDTGSATTIISWKAVEEHFGLSRSSSEGGIHNFRRSQSSGAMGADGTAIQLSHCLDLQTLELGDVQVGFRGDAGALSQGFALDIGDLPVLQALADENIVGVMGLNLLEACFTAVSVDLRAMEVAFFPTNRVERRGK